MIRPSTLTGLLAVMITQPVAAQRVGPGPSPIGYGAAVGQDGSNLPMCIPGPNFVEAVQPLGLDPVDIVFGVDTSPAPTLQPALWRRVTVCVWDLAPVPELPQVETAVAAMVVDGIVVSVGYAWNAVDSERYFDAVKTSLSAVFGEGRVQQDQSILWTQDTLKVRLFPYARFMVPAPPPQLHVASQRGCHLLWKVLGSSATFSCD